MTTDSESDSQTTRIIARPGPKDLPFGRPAHDVASAPEVRHTPDLEPPAVDVAPVAPSRPSPALPPKSAGIASVLVPPVAATSKPRPVAEADAADPAPKVPDISPFVERARAAPAPSPEPAPAAIEPVVGWLVVVRGPGRGASLGLRGGRNSLGAAVGEDVRLGFGDAAIAPAGHAYLAYDDEVRGFFIEDGKKKELVRLNGQMLSETRPLAHGDHIRIGRTTLRFVAFCGPDFDWSAEEAPEAGPGPSGG